MVFIYADGLSSPEKFAWWLLLNAIQLLQVIDLLEWEYRSSHGASNGIFGIFRFSVTSLATAGMWMIHSIIFLPTMELNAFCFTFVAISAFAGASIPILSACRLLSLSYIITLLLPLAYVTLNSDKDYQQSLGYISIFLFIVLIPVALKISNFTIDAIHQKNINEELMLGMEKERNRVATANTELQFASTELNQVNLNLENEVKKRTEEIFELSNKDSLTQLVNRNTFTTNLQAFIDGARDKEIPLALLFIDLNGFKKINDTMGHKVGDSVLVQVTQRIVAFAETDRVGRWGGDEFLVALPYSNEETAMSIASAIVTSIDQPIFAHGKELSLSASIGIAMAPSHSSSATELIQLADLTMSEQKKSSAKSPRMFSEDLKLKIENSQKILEGLQLANQRKQLFLCYQPIVCAKSHKAWAFEALLRWDFYGTFIGPDKFIPLAEKSGLIKEIGAWVLNRACLDANFWLYCADATVSVNVSVIQLMDDGFIRLLDNCLHSSKLPPERLHLEITESTFVENESKVRFQLEQIQKRNVKLSIDDFGTGYSSLSQLQTLPVNHVKIDKTFVDNINGKGEAIIRATQFIAKELNCATIAEGVETIEQAELLLAMGVDYLQGYYFSRPLRNQDLEAWLNTQSQTTS